MVFTDMREKWSVFIMIRKKKMAKPLLTGEKLDTEIHCTHMSWPSLWLI